MHKEHSIASDKWNGRDVGQVNALPPDFIEIYLTGSSEEVRQAIEEIRVRERFQGINLFDRAAEEFLYDWKSLNQNHKNTSGIIDRAVLAIKSLLVR